MSERDWLSNFEKYDYPGWAYFLVILTLGLAKKPIERFFRWHDAR